MIADPVPMYCSVPRIAPSPVRSALMVGANTRTGPGGRSFASPKFRSFAPALVSTMLPGFRSQWTVPWRRALSRASRFQWPP